MKTKITLITILSFLWAGTIYPQNGNQPRLVLQITVDQLRGDLPEKFMKNMGDGGFRYLKAQGVWYANAHYGHANTETVVGHTVLATGADPAVNGMISNVWFDREKGRLVYNIEDARYPILTENADVDASTEIDKSQVIASTDGRSPANIITTTFSDELMLMTNDKAKVFGVSVKDRGAVTMAGHTGKAFWFSKPKGEFITSSYYYKEYPKWVKQWNKRKFPDTYNKKAWKLMHDKSTYLYGKEDDQPWEMDMAGFGRTFPHEYGPADGAYYGSYLTFSPAGDEITLEFAKALIEAEDIGQDDITDYLSISFSSTDYVGHLFGPSSLEAEDNMLRLDRTLAGLFAFVDEKVGLENTLIVLSADHGGPEVPGYLESFGIESGYVSPDHWDKEPSIQTLKQKFGIGQELIHDFFPPYLYLNEKIIKEKGLDLEEVEKAVAKELMNIKGVALAVSSFALQKNQLPDTYLNRKALRNFNRKRSGNLLILFEPQYFINDFNGEKVAVNHGGPWMYDSYVPVIFAGSRLKAQRIVRKTEPKDIASTLANILGTKPPSGADGEVLNEVVNQLNKKYND
ncbi:MAG: alkaline phosphatase family protein [Bacteroidales bacterium]|nr:alkaline phosphatase family protein [Bacteroidales bacterium]